jgi:hypothetical protein
MPSPMQIQHGKHRCKSQAPTYRLAAAVQSLTGALDGASPARFATLWRNPPTEFPPQQFVGIGPTSPDGLHNLLCTSVGRIEIPKEVVISLRTEGRDR